MVNWNEFVKDESAATKSSELRSLRAQRRKAYKVYRYELRAGRTTRREKEKVVEIHNQILTLQGKGERNRLNQEMPDTPYMRYQYLSYSEQDGYKLQDSWSDARKDVTYVNSWYEMSWYEGAKIFEWKESGWVELTKNGKAKAKKKVSENDLNG